MKDYFVYVSLRDEDAIAIYKMDPVTGGLNFSEKQPVKGGPGSMNIDPEKKHLYVALRSINSYAAFNVDHETGKLTLIKTTPVVDNPVYNSTDLKGKFLLTAYYAGGKSAIYPIENDGSISDNAVQAFTNFTNPHSILVDPTNRFVFMPDKGGDKIYQYKFDETTGMITPNDPAAFVTPAGTGPRHFLFCSEKNLVYLVNELNGTITIYKLDQDKGTLSEIQNVSTLAADFSGVNTSADIHMTADKRFAYATNRGPDNIAAFSVDEETGMLKMISLYPTEKTPRSFNIDPHGQFLIVAGEDSDNLAAYKINKATGELEALSVIPVGKRPSWVLIEDF